LAVVVAVVSGAVVITDVVGMIELLVGKGY